MEPIQKAFEADDEWKTIEQQAYPPPEEKKKEKKKKDKGSRYPGGGAPTGVEAQPDGSVEGATKEEVSVGKDVDQAMEKLKLEKEAVAGKA